MNGEQFNHLSAELRAFRNEIISRLEKVGEKLDQKPNQREVDAFHTRLTKHQRECEEEFDELHSDIDNLTQALHTLEKRQDKSDTKLGIIWKIFSIVGAILAVFSQSDWVRKWFGG